MAAPKTEVDPRLGIDWQHEFNSRRLHAAKLIAAGCSISKALRTVGYSPKTAKGQPASVVGPIRELARREMIRQGITLPAIFERLHTRLYSLTLKNVKDAQGRDTTVEVEDNGSQLEAIRIAGDFWGLKAPTQVEHSGSVNLTMEEKRRAHGETVNRLVGYLE